MPTRPFEMRHTGPLNQSFISLFFFFLFLFKTQTGQVQIALFSDRTVVSLEGDNLFDIFTAVTLEARILPLRHVNSPEHSTTSIQGRFTTGVPCTLARLVIISPDVIIKCCDGGEAPPCCVHANTHIHNTHTHTHRSW